MNNNKEVKHKSQRVGIFIDTQNLYHSARSNYHANVNYKALVEEAVSGRRLVRAFAYVIKSDTGEENKFFDALVDLGIETRVKDLQVFYNGEKKADWDVGIAIDIVRMCEKLDVVVLVSGDGDFTEVMKYVRSRGIRAEIMAFKKTTSMLLVNESDAFIDLGDNPAKYLIPVSRQSSSRQSNKPRMDSNRSSSDKQRMQPGRPNVNKPIPARNMENIRKNALIKKIGR